MCYQTEGMTRCLATHPFSPNILQLFGGRRFDSHDWANFSRTILAKMGTITSLALKMLL